MNERDKVEQAELDRYGIQRVPTDTYLWGGYRYSNARDAHRGGKEECQVTSPRRRPEDTAEGCRSLAANDLVRAGEMVNPHMRHFLRCDSDKPIHPESRRLSAAHRPPGLGRASLGSCGWTGRKGAPVQLGPRP